MVLLVLHYFVSLLLLFIVLVINPNISKYVQLKFVSNVVYVSTGGKTFTMISSYPRNSWKISFS